MNIEITRETATTFMRWVIVLALFGGLIAESNKVDSLQQQLDTAKAMLESKRTDLQVCWQTYNDTCKK